MNDINALNPCCGYRLYVEVANSHQTLLVIFLYFCFWVLSPVTFLTHLVYFPKYPLCIHLHYNGIIWHYDKKGIFFVNSAYFLAIKLIPSPRPFPSFRSPCLSGVISVDFQFLTKSNTSYGRPVGML